MWSNYILQVRVKTDILTLENTLTSSCKTELGISSVQSLSRVRLFATPLIAARQASLSITNSWSSLRLTSIESVMPSSHLILWRPLLLLPPIPPSIRVFYNESTLHIRWPKYCSFSFSISDRKLIQGCWRERRVKDGFMKKVVLEPGMEDSKNTHNRIRVMKFVF